MILSRRETKKQEKRELILKASVRLFHERGYHNTTIADIIRETKLARGTFYLYYQKKQEIFDELLGSLYVSLASGVLQFTVENFKERESFYEQLVQLGHRLVAILKKHQDIAQVLVSGPIGSDNSFDQKVQDFFNLLTEVTYQMIDRGVKTGRLVAHDSRLLALLVTGGLKEFVFQWLTKGLFADQLEEKVEQIIFFFVRGVEVR